MSSHGNYGDYIRGLLCGTCNTALGMLGDDIGRINGLADYLTEFLSSSD